MGFPPPLQVYLDPPTTWRQELCVLTTDNHNHLPPSLPPPTAAFGGGPGPGSVRPTSMAERARLAKLPQPEETLGCPRCNSTNTKFCYFNNYSLSQPRHFCKTCRRYWTRGGALRNVPVGGGCRRNKRSKRNRSKSPSSVNHSTSVRSVADVRSHLNVPQLHSLPFLSAPPPTLQDYNHGGISFDGLLLPPHVGAQGGRMAGDFQIGGGAATGAGSGGGCREAVAPDNWEMQQFPFLGSCGGLPDTQGGFFSGVDEQGRGKMDEGQWQMGSSASSREFLSISGNNQYWGGWTGISGFPSSSSATSLH